MVKGIDVGRKPAKSVASAVDMRYKRHEICPAESLYFITYDGKPFNLRVNDMARNQTFKYGRVSFPSAVPAINMARRLNRLFHTDKFMAARMVQWEAA